MDQADLIAELRTLLATCSEEIVCAYLYGSTARAQDRPTSDVDIAVLYREAPTATLDGLGLEVAGVLERRLRRPVDLVVLNRAPPDLVHRILSDGVLVLDRDPSRRIAFEVKSRNEYFDVLPYLREYRRAASASRP